MLLHAVSVGTIAARPENPMAQTVIPVLEEIIEVTTRKVETGRVRVSVKVEEYEYAIDTSGWVEELAVERVPVNRVVNPARPPTVRQEGDTLIIPVFEETLILEKKLVLAKRRGSHAHAER